MSIVKAIECVDDIQWLFMFVYQNEKGETKIDVYMVDSTKDNMGLTSFKGDIVPLYLHK